MVQAFTYLVQYTRCKISLYLALVMVIILLFFVSLDPSMFATEGPTQRYVLLGDSLSLLCGTGLDSNPAATITWTAPDMTIIMDNARYDLENGPDIVRLNFTHTIPSDTGVWVCDATAVSEKYIVSNGQLVRQDNAVIGTATVRIQLTVIGEYLFTYCCRFATNICM